MTCVSGVLVPCWTLYYKAVSGLADDLKGVWVECSAEFVSLVLLDKNFIISSMLEGLALRCMSA